MSEYMDYLARRIGYKSYNDYLKSDHWKSFSNSVKVKSCYCCGKKEGLQVHHKTYARLGKEYHCDVVTVCGECHTAIHKLASDGSPLNQAHVLHKQSLPKSKLKGIRNSNHQKNWTNWFNLVNKSIHQTLDQLRDFLMSRKLSDGEKATPRAYRLGFVKRSNGKEVWNRRNTSSSCRRTKDSVN